MTRGADIQHVGREGKRIRTRALDVRILASPLAYSRIGVVVPRHRHSAVDRNRVKRRLRELVRLELLPLLADTNVAIDAVMRASPAAYDSTFAQLRAELETIARRITSVRRDEARSS